MGEGEEAAEVEPLVPFTDTAVVTAGDGGDGGGGLSDGRPAGEGDDLAATFGLATLAGGGGGSEDDDLSSAAFDWAKWWLEEEEEVALTPIGRNLNATLDAAGSLVLARDAARDARVRHASPRVLARDARTAVQLCTSIARLAPDTATNARALLHPDPADDPEYASEMSLPGLAGIECGQQLWACYSTSRDTLAHEYRCLPTHQHWPSSTLSQPSLALP